MATHRDVISRSLLVDLICEVLRFWPWLLDVMFFIFPFTNMDTLSINYFYFQASLS